MHVNVRCSSRRHRKLDDSDSDDESKSLLSSSSSESSTDSDLSEPSKGPRRELPSSRPSSTIGHSFSQSQCLSDPCHPPPPYSDPHLPHPCKYDTLLLTKNDIGRRGRKSSAMVCYFFVFCFLFFSFNYLTPFCQSLIEFGQINGRRGDWQKEVGGGSTICLTDSLPVIYTLTYILVINTTGNISPNRNEDEETIAGKEEAVSLCDVVG